MTQKEMNHFRNTLTWIGFLLMLVIFTGCTTAQSGTPESKNTLTSPNNTSTVSTDITPSPASTTTSEIPKDTATSAPSIVPTQTPLPTVHAASTSTAIPTLTPLPTISPSQRGQAYNDLMSSNGGCTLPCWWGFELGKASIDEVRQLYTSFNTYISEQKGRDEISVLEVIFVDPQIKNGLQTRHVIYAQNSVVIEAEIQLGIYSDYQLEPIFEKLGQPSEVWLWTIPDPYEGILPVYILLYFPEQGVLFGYATEAISVGDNVKICLDEPGEGIILLWNPAIWNPNGDKGFVERANESSELTLENHRPINEVSNWSVEQFYTVFSNPVHSECLETPSEMWSSP